MSNTINVKVGNQNNIRVAVGNQSATKVVASNMSAASSNSISGVVVDLTGIQDNFVLQYDASNNKIIAVDPDQILQDAVPGGIPADFINVLDSDPNRTDNVDFDGGSF